MQRRRIERFWDAHIHAGIALLAALVSLAPSLVEAQGPVRESSFSLTAPVRQAVDSEGPSPTYLEEPERDLGYRRAVRLYGFASALTVLAAGGVVAGAAVWAAVRFGVARGIFSNEAGLGSAPIAHAAAQTKNPINQGMVAMLGTFIDTIIVCSITGLVIISSGAWTSGETGAALTSLAFETGLPGFGNYVVAISLAIFAFTTIIGWSFYGERCIEFLFGVKAIVPYRVIWILAIPVGATINLGLIWLIADTLNAMMALPNLVALLLLSPVVFKLTREHFEKERSVGVS